MSIATMATPASAKLAVTSAGASIALPGTTPTTVIVSNFGNNPAFFNLSVGAGSVTIAAGLCILPGYTSVPIAVSTNTFLNAITQAGGSAMLSIDTGT